LAGGPLRTARGPPGGRASAVSRRWARGGAARRRPATSAAICDFGEQLALRMREQNLGGVGNLDTAIDDLSISISSPRHLGAARTLIRKTLAKHHLDAHAVVVAI